jgi:hypothetical protein
MNKHILIIGLIILSASAVGFWYYNSLEPKNEEAVVLETLLSSEEGVRKEQEKSLGILNLEDVSAVIAEPGVELTASFIDLRDQVEPNHPETENIGALYKIVFETNIGRNITLNVSDLNHEGRATVHYDRVRRQTPGSQIMEDPIGDASAKTLANPNENLGNIVLVKKGDVVFQLHTFEPNDLEPLTDIDGLAQLARLIESRLEISIPEQGPKPPRGKVIGTLFFDEQPASGHIEVFQLQPKQEAVTIFGTYDDGTYWVSLTPGIYLLRPQFEGCGVTEVEVFADQEVEALLSCETPL